MKSDDFLVDYSGVLSIFSSVHLFDSTHLFNTSDQEENQSRFWSVGEKKSQCEFISAVLEVSTTDEEKRCYACKDADDECVTPCSWTQRCYLKARHANATSLFSLDE